MTVKGRKFNSKHLIATASIAMALWLLISGIMAPDSFIMSFASAGLTHSVLRGIVIAGLIVVLISRPPRSAQVRLLLGTVSAMLVTGSCASIVNYQIGILDIILYTQVAIILAIEAIEIQTAPVRFARNAAPAR